MMPSPMDALHNLVMAKQYMRTAFPHAYDGDAHPQCYHEAIDALEHAIVYTAEAVVFQSELYQQTQLSE